MTHAAELNVAGNKQARFQPGFLLAPFNWATDWLASAVESDPPLLAEIYFLSRRRMHLIALALAHLDSGAQANAAQLLLRGRAGEILDRVLGRRPGGLKRALDNLQPEVLSPAGYRRLIELLDDPVSAKFIAHAALIDDDDLQTLAEIPVALRPLAIPVATSTPATARGLAGGLNYLVARGAAPSFEALVAELKSLRQPPQLAARLRKLVEALPLPMEIPPPRIGPARRLDEVAEIRELSRRWRNCLERMYLPDINEGKCVVYLWDEAQAPAACRVTRCHRLGWFLSEVCGPKNARPDPERLAQIHETFAAAGILQYSVVRAVIEIVEFVGEGRSRPGGVRNGAPADIRF